MIQVVADDRSFGAVARGLRAEADGQELVQDLAEQLRAALEPAVGEVRAAVLGMASAGLPHGGESLRAAVAAAVVSEVRVTGGSAVARIRATKRAMPRGFANAPARLNARRGWKHPVHGRTSTWVTQMGAPGWFDDTIARGRDRYERAAREALDRVARRVARRTTLAP